MNNVKMVELVNLKEKIRERERESKKMGWARWSSLGLFLGSVFYAVWYSWFFSEDAGQAEPIKKFFKFIYYFFIIAAVIGLLTAIVLTFYRYPKICEEIKQLKLKEKALEKQLANE